MDRLNSSKMGTDDYIFKKYVQRVKPLLPALFSLAALGILALMSTAGAPLLPLWVRIIIGALWMSSLIHYVIITDLQKHIGGWMAILTAILIVFAMLCPVHTLEKAPIGVAEAAHAQFRAAWETVYSGDLFEHFSPKETIGKYLRSIGELDPYNGGRILAFAILGFFVSVCFLYPISITRKTPYLKRLSLTAIALTLFAIQTELAQTLSPTRRITLNGMLMSMTGASMGMALLVALQWTQDRLCAKRNKQSRRFNTLGVAVDAITMKDCLDAFDTAIGGRSGQTLPLQVAPMGVAGIIQSRRDPAMQRILNNTYINTPDGMPLVWLGKLRGYRDIERVYGPDMMYEACKASVNKGWTHYFYGAAEGVARKLKQNLAEEFPAIRVLGVESPPFRPLTEEEEDDLVARIEQLRPDFFWIGISTPKQLYLMEKLSPKLNCKVICPVGYAFDVYAGNEADAPEWMKLAGFQWLHRLIKQPRLWKRYLPDNPRFVVESALQLLHLRKYPLFRHTIPTAPYKDPEGLPRFPVGVVSLSATTLDQACERVSQWIQTGRRTYVNVCTADTMVKCFDMPKMARIVQNAGMATTDGMPLVFLAHRYGFKEATRVYGPDLMLKVCETSQAQGYKHYFYGATEDVLHALKKNLRKAFPGLKIAGADAPPFRPLTPHEKRNVIETINKAAPDIVWCGLGTPKQDLWVSEFRKHLNASVLIAVGAAFNFHAGTVKQAPRWMMNSGLEWLYRLAVEPRRLWRRYLVGNPRFIHIILRCWLRSRTARKRETPQPGPTRSQHRT